MNTTGSIFLNQEQALEILRHYADPIDEQIDHDKEACGHCQRQLINKLAAEEELKKPTPSYFAFLKKSEDLWKESRHYKAWVEIAKTAPEGLDKSQKFQFISQKMRELGLEP